jgi:thioredoxin 1
MLLYFYSEHCGACRPVTPLIDELSRARQGVVKVDVRRHIDTARRFGIMGTPSLVLVDKGQIARVHVGAISDGYLQQFYDGPAR